MAKQAVLTEYNLSSSKLDRPLTIAQVSDLHERNADDILALLKSVKPDLIAVTGDSFERFCSGETDVRFIKKTGVLRRVVLGVALLFDFLCSLFRRKRNTRDPEAVRRFFREASPLAPVFMSLGNHEEKLREEDLDLLRRCGVTLLNNADTDVWIGGCRLRIGGLPTDADESWLRSFARKDGFKLLLCHHPEYFDTMVAPLKIDLVLAGHNHGGQIKLFGHGVFSSSGGLFPKYDSGLFNGRMIVSAGCSNTFSVPRIGNPRELVAIHLKRDKRDA